MDRRRGVVVWLAALAVFASVLGGVGLAARASTPHPAAVGSSSSRIDRPELAVALAHAKSPAEDRHERVRLLLLGLVVLGFALASIAPSWPVGGSSAIAVGPAPVWRGRYDRGPPAALLA